MTADVKSDRDGSALAAAQAAYEAAAREGLACLGPLRTADDYARPMIVGLHRLWELSERSDHLRTLAEVADPQTNDLDDELRELVALMGAVADLIACQAGRCATDHERARRLAGELVEMITRRAPLLSDFHDDYFACYDFDDAGTLDPALAS